jgi:hypothetical protein
MVCTISAICCQYHEQGTAQIEAVFRTAAQWVFIFAGRRNFPALPSKAPRYSSESFFSS